MSSMTRALRRQVWTVFVTMNRDAFYPLAELARVVGVTPRDLRERVRRGEITTQSRSGVAVVRWADIACVAIDRWGLSIIASHLGDRVATALPALLHPLEFVTRLPVYQVAMIQHLAARERVAEEDFLSDHLLDLAASEADFMERQLPGFTAAMRFPDA